MKIMWLSHVLKKVAKETGVTTMATGGWVDGLAEKLMAYHRDDCEIISVFAQGHSDKEIRGKISLGGGVINYVGIPEAQVTSKRFKALFSEINPDILHVFGTENFTNFFTVIKTFNNPKRTIVNLQGFTTIWGRHYTDGIPDKIVRRKTLRDWLRNDSILKWQKEFLRAAKTEIKVIEYCQNFFGRTDCDRAVVTQINPSCNYFYCGEILREEFYSPPRLWNYDDCEKHSLFTAQAHYPVKGLHFLIEAMGIIAKKYPDVKLYVGGNKLRYIPKDFKDYMMQSSYARYCWDMIKKYGLRDKIFFTGVMDAGAMIERFLKTHVYVCPSTMENSPNSLCEAELLAMPCVASDVGGISNLIQHKQDGYLYQANAPYMLAYYVDEIFEKKERASELGQKARENILKLVDPKINTDRVVEVYRELLRS